MRLSKVEFIVFVFIFRSYSLNIDLESCSHELTVRWSLRGTGGGGGRSSGGLLLEQFSSLYDEVDVPFSSSISSTTSTRKRDTIFSLDDVFRNVEKSLSSLLVNVPGVMPNAKATIGERTSPSGLSYRRDVKASSESFLNVLVSMLMKFHT